MTQTSKRQAMLPRELGEELGVPGDPLDVDRAVVDGTPAWVLRPHRVDWSWIGSAHAADGISHDLDANRASIRRGMAEDHA